MSILDFFILVIFGGVLLQILTFIWKELERIANALVTLCNYVKARR